MMLICMAWHRHLASRNGDSNLFFRAQGVLGATRGWEQDDILSPHSFYTHTHTRDQEDRGRRKRRSVKPARSGTRRAKRSKGEGTEGVRGCWAGVAISWGQG